MRESEMTELEFEAPLAKFDGEEWNEFYDFQTSTSTSTSSGLDNHHSDSRMPTEKNDNSVEDNFNETFSGSLEDLVNTFDGKITKSFFNYEEKVEQFAPVQVRSQEEIMSDCQMWWTITGNYGNILPIDWSASYARQLQEQSLNVVEKWENESPDLDLSDEEDLQQELDIHSLIISSLQREPIFTAEEVIHEIEGMMEDSPSPDSTPTGSDILSSTSSELSHCKDRPAPSPGDYEESWDPYIDHDLAISGAVSTPPNSLQTTETQPGLESLSVPELGELAEELSSTIKHFSETLVQQLALRDEYEYEKELQNQFISLLLSVQKKRRETQLEKNKNLKKQKAIMGPDHGTYLTTVIPYHANQGTPRMDQLQIYIKILSAINEDSQAVPGLLTDYILKVLCPTT